MHAAVILLATFLAMATWAVAADAQPPGGALAGQRPRILVSTDIGGADPDDFQSMVHLFIYREITKQGAIDPAPKAGFSEATEGSRWIIARAQADNPRPLWVLGWGCLTDVAQAIHDAPEIKSRIRIYSIGSWNTAQDPAAREYLFAQHPDLWWIEADTTFRGMYMGGPQEDDLGNRTFPAKHLHGHGALGAFFMSKKAEIKMGDTPSLLYLLRGPADDPTAGHWGGAFVRPAANRTYWHDDPAAERAENGKQGAKSVSTWREAFLRDWQQRMLRTKEGAQP